MHEILTNRAEVFCCFCFGLIYKAISTSLSTGLGLCPEKGSNCRKFIILTIGGKLPNLEDVESLVLFNLLI